MIQFDKEELLKIAELSALRLDEDQIESFANDIRQVLDYTSELDEINPSDTLHLQTHVNVFREDVVHSSHAQEVLKQAPETSDGYFTVPKIL